MAAGGFHASFQLGRSLPYPGRIPYGFRDLVYSEPSTCPPAPSETSVGTVGTGKTLYPFMADGAFGLSSDGLKGGITGEQSASLSATFYSGSSTACHGTLVWRFHPAQRVAVSDGTWRLSGAGANQSFTVLGGGRIVEGISLTTCGGVGAVDLFIPPNGKVETALPIGGQLTLAFNDRTATGQLEAQTGASCTSSTVPLTASLVRPAT